MSAPPRSTASLPAPWSAAFADARARLASAHEARVLVEEVAGETFAAILGGTASPPTPAEIERLALLVGRRRSGEPLQHVVGHWAFRGLELVVDARALVPRPETEVVAGIAVAALAQRATAAVRDDAPAARSDRDATSVGLRALDLGTGSGAIACAIVSEVAGVEVVGVDISPEALALAGENRARLTAAQADRLELRPGSWFDAVAGETFDCVVANPPYLADAERGDLDAVVRDFDPPLALFAGPTGLEAISTVIAGAPAALRQGGTLVVEIAPHQALVATDLARAAGAREVDIVRDLAGRERVLVGSW